MYAALGSRLSALGFAGLVLLSACKDEKPQIDADLARDLQLATAQPAQPALNDAPLDAPTPEPVSTPRPSRTPTPRQATRTPRAPVPSPRAESPRPRAAVEESPEPRAAVQPARFRGILAGTSFGVTTKAPVCTNARPGDKYVATVTSAVVGEDGATIPLGSTVVLEVASVTVGDSPESSQITLRVRSVVVEGSAHAVDGSAAVASGLERGPAAASGSDKKKVIGGAIAGAVIGQVLGRDTRSTVIGAAAGAGAGSVAAAATRKYHACLPAGGSVRVTTSQPIAL